MGTPSSVWTDERYAVFVKQYGPEMGWQSRKLWRAFDQEFGKETAFNAFRLFAGRIRDGGKVVPPSTQRILTDETLSVTCKAALITSDWQLPYHDSEWAEFAFEMGKGFGCDLSVLNGDVLDMSALSRFDQQLSAHDAPLEGEFELAEEILSQMAKHFGEVVMDVGNHEWRFFRRLMGMKLPMQRMQRLFASERVKITEFSFVTVNDRVRVTHPRSYSRIAARVGYALASKHHCDVVVGHDHQVGYARDVSGRYTVVHSGCMADPRRMDYVQTADSTAPMMSKGFVILTKGGQLILFDALNCDRDFWRWVIAKGRQPA